MLIRHHTFTLISLAMFIISLYFGGMLTSSARVTHETATTQVSFSVKQGVTQDGNLSVTQILEAPKTPLTLKSQNHARTLRAFIGPARTGKLSVFVESIKPHAIFVLSGNFDVSQEFQTLSWTDATVLQFYGVDSAGRIVRIHLDVHALIATVEPVDETTLSAQQPQYLVAPD